MAVKSITYHTEGAHDRLYRVAKRGIDVFVSATTLIVISPLLLVIAAIIKLGDGGPVFFRHERVGRSGRRFVCLKFRSMVCDADRVFRRHLASNDDARREWEENQKLSDDPRVTAFGRFLRKSSLDELPQLFNILSGDMTLVGPRPITPSELERYGQYVGYYLSVKPGLTGLWQISGRNDCSYAERVALDVRYASAPSLQLDFVILMKTVPVVLFQRGSY